jgi:hypothetical protein
MGDKDEELTDLELDWLSDFIEADESGHLTPLIARLDSDAPMPKHAREWLADLLKRRQLKRLPGQQAVPIWTFSERDRALRGGELAYKLYRKAGMKRDEAIERVINEWPELAKKLAKDSDDPTTTFRNFLERKSGSSRRR